MMVLDGSNSIYPWSSIIDFLKRFLGNIEIGPKLSQVSVDFAANDQVDKWMSYITLD